MPTTVGIHIFRKDLRVVDNSALNKLAKLVDRVVGVFILDPIQIKSNDGNELHFSKRASRFVLESVKDLDGQCGGKLVVLYGKPPAVLEKLLRGLQPTHVSINADFTPYAIERDEAIANACSRKNVELIVDTDDQCVLPMESLLKKDGIPYMIFGPFVKNLLAQRVGRPITVHINSSKWLKPRSIKAVASNRLDPTNDTEFRGGRTYALKILETCLSAHRPDHIGEVTSRLSAYVNLGCVSAREIWLALKGNHSILRSTIWKDFLLCIYRIYPNANSYDRFIDERYDQIRWPRVNTNAWSAFIEYRTGFLLVDAAMRELDTTGFISNRARLILATFWIKYMHINPLDRIYGSQTGFSRRLVDCSASQNKLNHQWVIGDLDFAGRRFAMKGTPALTGRMIRVDNDMIKKYDPNYEYISAWIPELEGLTKKKIKQYIKQVNPMFNWRERYGQYIGLFSTIT